jgi:hypothetical protein
MRVTTVSCDRCRRVIADHPAAVVKLEGLGSLHDLPQIDRCAGCATELRGWLRPDDQGQPEPAGLCSD